MILFLKPHQSLISGVQLFYHHFALLSVITTCYISNFNPFDSSSASTLYYIENNQSISYTAELDCLIRIKINKTDQKTN